MKKGMDSGILKNIIIYLILIVIMMFFVQQITMYSYDIGQKKSCEESVKNNARRLVIMGTDLTDKYGSTAAINCRTDYKPIDSSDDEKIKRELANKMVDAWDMFGKGELELFATEDETYCVITHVVSFKKTGELDGFTNYLADMDAPKKGMRYIEFFQGRKMEDGELTTFENKFEDTIDLDKEQAIVFIMNKDAHLGKLASAIWIGHNVGFLTGAGAGSVKARNTYIVAKRAIAADAAMGSSHAASTAAEAFYVVDEAALEAAQLSSIETVESTLAKNSIKGARFAGRSIKVLAASAILFAGVGTATGYLLGDDFSSDWNARLLLWEYDDIGELDCTYLEGKSGYLEHVEYE